MAMPGKLVRDRIPDIVRASGRSPLVRQLGDDELLPALLDKLQEEVDELREATTVADRTEEMADVLEVLGAIATDLGLDWSAVEVAAATKRDERGGFQDGLWMELP
jgi:predicted house-cleaning noncanonical NTP pyrophosphatase (MazG superfamily)